MTYHMRDMKVTDEDELMRRDRRVSLRTAVLSLVLACVAFYAVQLFSAEDSQPIKRWVPPPGLAIPYVETGARVCRWRIGIKDLLGPAKRRNYFRFLCRDDTVVEARTIIK